MNMVNFWVDRSRTTNRGERTHGEAWPQEDRNLLPQVLQEARRQGQARSREVHEALHVTNPNEEIDHGQGTQEGQVPPSRQAQQVPQARQA